MIYSTGTCHLLSVILTKSSDMSTLAFANRYLFRPMDIVVGGWDRDPQGYFMGGNNLARRYQRLIFEWMEDYTITYLENHSTITSTL